MTRPERLVVTLACLAALLSAGLAVTNPAYGDGVYCDWTMYVGNCSGGYCDIYVEDEFCSQFNGDCDAACDAEFDQCVYECIDLDGRPSACTVACNKTLIKCAIACIAWM